MEEGEPIWLPRETRSIIYSFHRELIRRENEKREKFAPVLKEILILGKVPAGVRQHAKKCATKRYFHINKLLYFRELYREYNDVRKWACASVPENTPDQRSSRTLQLRPRKDQIIKETFVIWNTWKNVPTLDYSLDSWDEVYRVAKGIYRVCSRSD